MADIRITSGVAVTGLPVNKVPLVDATTGATIQGAVAYNQAGLALFFHFVTTAGVYTEAAVTPTTAGLYDWTDSGTSGVYTIEMPISGGTTNAMNTRTGTGWFTGVATGILPWASPTFEFVPASISDALTDGTKFLRTHPAPFSVAGTTYTAENPAAGTQFTETLTATPGANPTTGLT